MALDNLRISQCPAAFAEFAAKHNALVDMLAAMKGSNGIKVTVSESNAVLANDIAAITAAVIAALATSAVTIQTLTVTGNSTVTGDAFFSYVESSGDVYASGDLYANGSQIGRLNSVQTCDPAATSDFLIYV